MKKRLLFYNIAPLAIIALIVGVISSATEICPTPKAESPQVSVEASTPPGTPTEPTAVKKKACGCCADRLARLLEQLRKAQERRQIGQQVETKAITQQTPAKASNSEHRDD